MGKQSGRLMILTAMFVLLAAQVYATPSAGAAKKATAGRPLLQTLAADLDQGSWGATAASPCTGLDTSLCMLPFPNDYYTVADPTTATKRRVDIPSGAFPAAVGQPAFDPSAWNSLDGFSPGSTLLIRVPSLDLSQSGVATLSDIGQSLRLSSPVVLIDTTNGQRWPTWSELDVDNDASARLLLIHPARSLTEGDHYVVALRDLKGASGQTLSPPGAFQQVLSDSTPTTGTQGQLPAPLVTHLRHVVSYLNEQGVTSRSLYEAWDFTVGSERSIAGPALDMRNEAFSALGTAAPTFHITKVTNDPSGLPTLARTVSGTFSVPDFLVSSGSSMPLLHTGPNGKPTPVGDQMFTARFDCEIPRAATARHPAHVGVYGHGLFNDDSEVYASWVPQFSNAYDYVFCGTDWLGLSSNDVGPAATVVTNLDAFPTLPDQLMQSLLNAQFLGRLLDDASGFAAHPAFQNGAGRPLIAPRSGLVYYGNSLGGIMGGAFTALSTDVRRSVLGVPGADFDLLLSRSADFQPFNVLFNHAYPNRAVQLLGEDIIQMLWDRGEADGYLAQMTNHPLAGTPTHEVLMAEAFGDHQVANVATETEARTIGARIHEPALAPGRSNERVPFWGLASLDGQSPGPSGASLFVWDSGVPAPPLADRPPNVGPDPHDTTPRSDPAFWHQMAVFFSRGVVSNPCGHGPCHAPYPKAGS